MSGKLLHRIKVSTYSIVEPRLIIYTYVAFIYSSCCIKPTFFFSFFFFGGGGGGGGGMGKREPCIYCLSICQFLDYIINKRACNDKIKKC